MTDRWTDRYIKDREAVHMDQPALAMLGNSSIHKHHQTGLQGHSDYKKG